MSTLCAGEVGSLMDILPVGIYSGLKGLPKESPVVVHKEKSMDGWAETTGMSITCCKPRKTCSALLLSLGRLGDKDGK